MRELYEQDLSPDRFHAYLAKLQGDSKGDLKLPIGGFNPMAKAHILEKIGELESLKAEEIMTQALANVNSKMESLASKQIKVVLNLADDLKGGWTNRYTTDFDSKFKINALVERDFCTPYFWSSENYTEQLIMDRTRAYAYRTIYWLQNSRLRSLKDHFEQEVFVNKQMGISSKADENLERLAKHYEEFKDEDDYSLIFNFFYGDAASESLSYPQYGVRSSTGFELSKTS